MHVLVIAPYVPWPADHGGRIRSNVLLSALRQHHRVQLAVPLADATARQNALELGAVLGITVHELPARTVARRSWWRKLAHWSRLSSELFARRWMPLSRDAVQELLRRHAFDLVVVDSSYVLPILPAAMPPMLLHLHNIESALIGRRDAVRRGFVERRVRAIEAMFMARAEAAAAARALVTITVSELDQQRVLALAPHARAYCVENSVDLQRLPQLPPPPDGAPLLLFVGSFDYPPNFEAARELVTLHLPALQAAFPGLRVRFIGTDTAGVGRGLAPVPGVELAGHVDDLLPHYRAASAIYLPIRSGGGTRIKVLEAFALGRVVLSTRIGVEGLGLQDGREYLGFETPTEGVAALRRGLSTAGAPWITAARALVGQRWDHTVAAAKIASLVAAHAPLPQAARPLPEPPLAKALRAFAAFVGRPLGALLLMLRAPRRA